MELCCGWQRAIQGCVNFAGKIIGKQKQIPNFWHNRSKFKQKYLISYNSYMLKMKCSNIYRMVKGRLATPKCSFHIATHACALKKINIYSNKIIRENWSCNCLPHPDTFICPANRLRCLLGRASPYEVNSEVFLLTCQLDCQLA